MKNNNEDLKNRKILLGMSGGVDSCVAAILLKKQGYEVIGATMRLWEEEDAISSIEDAKKICAQLGIQHYTFDFREEFRECVIKNFIDVYSDAKTPNPCIECNKYLKFNSFYKKALELECNYIATGHYAKTEFSEEYNEYVIKKSNAGKKDQSYVLYNIPKEIIKNVLFPLGEFESKEEIREIAKEYGLGTASKSDSQEICFIPNNDYVDFLKKNMNERTKEGNIVDIKGNILGKHKGLIYYTIGQRKGLGISEKHPLYVIELNKEKNEVVVGKEEDIYSNELYADNVNYTLNKEIKEPIEIMAKIRYSAKEAKAVLIPINDRKVKIEFEEPQRAVTKGQSVVFYLDDVVLGGGKII